jgi:hypothetical protein
LGSVGFLAARTGRSEAFMQKKIREEERETEDQMARRELGPRGEPGAPDPAKMTPQRKKKLPECGDFDGHSA